MIHKDEPPRSERGFGSQNDTNNNKLVPRIGNGYSPLLDKEAGSVLVNFGAPGKRGTPEDVYGLRFGEMIRRLFQERGLGSEKILFAIGPGLLLPLGYDVMDKLSPRSGGEPNK